MIPQAKLISDAVNRNTEEVDLYEVLGIQKSASKSEIKKAYHRSALANHPDKVPESEREQADVRFKAVSAAYEILYDDDTRHLYDTHGMSAFEKCSNGPGGSAADMEMDDILAQMFGAAMGGNGMPGRGAGGQGRQRKPRKGDDEVQTYEVTLEELYKGKTTRFSSTKNVICSHCRGTGGKEDRKPKACETCKGKGVYQKLQSVGPGLVTQVTTNCSTCNGAGSFFKDKDRCKRCKGARVVQQKKILELYIPPGSREGERIVLEGEADQHPDQEAGNLVFMLAEVPHETFGRAGADLSADLDITLAEALTGFSRTVLKHLDGRGIQINTLQPTPKVLKPDQVLKVTGEGMPIKRSEMKGDLFLVVKIKFPEDGWLRDQASIDILRNILPKSMKPILAGEVDEVEFDAGASIEDFGAGSGDPRANGAEWEDEDDGTGAQCAQQ